jgi:hypothetical protein
MRPAHESAIGGLPRIGAIATMPSRLESFRAALPAIVPQVDRLYVFLDGHAAVPDFAVDPKIIAMRSSEEGALHCSGRFLGLGRETEDCIFATFDDDIVYPPDYVATLAAALVRFRARAVVGFHGVSFAPPFGSYLRDRTICHFQAGLSHDVRVDLLGTGTAAFVASRLPLDPRRWPSGTMDDLIVSLAAEDRGIPRVALARRPRYLRAIEQNQTDSIYAATQRDESVQTSYMRTLIDLEIRSPWGLPPRLPAPLPRRAG